MDLAALPHEPVQLLLTLAVLAVGSWLIKRIELLLRAMNQQVTEVHEQTKNKHRTNLRDDLDDIRDIVRDIQDRSIGQERDLARMRTTVSAVRRDLRAEIDHRTAFDDRLHGELAEERERSIAKDAELQCLIKQTREDGDRSGTAE